MHRTLHWLLSCAVGAAALCNFAPAQNIIVGGPGNNVLNGTLGPDDISDTAGTGDIDTLIDGTLGGSCSDPSKDHLNSMDGDNNDKMLGGPEDSFRGDPGDWVEIRTSDGLVLWQGPFAEYQRMKRLIGWLQYMLSKRWGHPYDGGWVLPQTWQAALTWAGDKLNYVEPVMVGDECNFEASFVIEEPGAWDGCWSPAEFWAWFPQDSDESESVPQTLVTHAEFEQSVADAQLLLAYLLEVLESGDSDVATDG